jgi:hypothetical protein
MNNKETYTHIEKVSGHCNMAQLSVCFFIDKKGYKAADANIESDSEELRAQAELDYEKVDQRANELAAMINKTCKQRCTFENLPFLRQIDVNDPENWFEPYQFLSFQPPEDIVDGANQFDITLEIDGGPFLKEDMKTFTAFVLGVLNEVSAQTGESIEYHQTIQYRRMTVSEYDHMDLS